MLASPRWAGPEHNILNGMSKGLQVQIRRLACLTFVLIVGARSQAPQTIRLTVDYNDGVRKEFVLPWKAGMTVFDAMTAAEANPHGLKFDCDRKFPCSGPAANRVLAYIDDLKNQGGGGSAKNWVFFVDDAFADQGFGVCKIADKDRILWKFDTFHGEPPGKACK
jgi:hypothetical protein